MRTLAVASPKGGVGKTTVALNLGFALAQRGWRTLLVDTDPQGGIGLSLTKRVAEAQGLADYVLAGAALPDVQIRTREPSLSLVPVGKIASTDLVRFSEALADGASIDHLAHEASGDFDVVLVDTPAGLGPITLGALRVATHVLAPIQAEPVALRASGSLIDAVTWLRAKGGNVKIAGVLLTMLQVRDRNSLHVAEEVWSRFANGLVLDATVPRHASFLQASTAGVPLGLLGRKPPPVARIFDQIAAELEPRIELARREDETAAIPLVD
jgi:chromosome partitioning protein